MKYLIKRLDKIANALETKGYVKEALEIDIIANTIEAFDENSLQGRILKEVLSKLEANNLKDAIKPLINRKGLFENIIENYGEFPASDNTYPAKDLFKSYEDIVSLIKQQNVNGAIEAVQNALKYLRKLAPIINDYSGVTRKTQEMQRNAPPPSEMTFSSPPKKGIIQNIFR